jgi:hypothetical protein
MILFDDARSLTIEGVTVLPDHRNDSNNKESSNWWYFQGPVRLARRGADDRQQFTCLTYRSDDASDDDENGGFLMVETDLAVPADVLERIKAQLRSISPGEPTLSPVQFDEGTVRVVALDLEGGGGTVPEGDQPGTFRAVEKILGTRVPSMAGDQNAAFSLQLSKEGAIIMKRAFEQGATPVGAIYEYKYTGLRPALDVKLTADLSRVYNHFSASIEGQYAWLKGGIEVALEFLRQEGAITVEVIDFTSEKDQQDKEKWALDFFAQHLLATWFTPTFSPAPAAGDGGGIKLPTVDDVKKAVGGVLGGDKKDDAKKDDAKKDEASKDAKDEKKDDKKDAAATAPSTTPKPPAAELVINSKSPDPLPEGLSVTHKPAAEGTVETISVTGSPATVKVDGKERPLGADGTVTADVAAGASAEIEVSWAEVPAKEESFPLFFDFDEPAKVGFSPVPSNRLFRSYLEDTVADDRFRGSKAPSGVSAATGAAALRAWIRDRLVSPKQVRIHAKASYEGHGQIKRGHNQELSERRLQIAKGVIGALASVTTGEATGQDPAQNETPLRDENDRVALVTGVVQPARKAATLKATLKRAKLPEKPAEDKKDEDGKDKDKKDEDKKDEGKGGSKTETPAALAFKLKFVHQNERKTVTIHYNRQEAVQRTYAPQGFFGLLLDDVDRASHFIDIDLNHAFFRVLEITVDAPFDLAALGISSAHVSIDYGAPDAPDRRHADMVFTPADHAEQSVKFFHNAAGDTTYRRAVQYHFDPASGWDGSEVVVEKPAVETADRTLLLNPFEDLAFIQVEVIPGRIDQELISAIDVDLEITEPDGTAVGRTLRVLPGAAPQRWKVRSMDPDARQYTYRLTHHLKDGTTRQQGPFTATAPVLQVDDPFADALEIDFVRLFDPATTRMALIDVLYDDASNRYRRDERLTMRSDDAELHLRMALLDPSQTQFRYRLTVVGIDNKLRQDSFVTTSDTLVLVQ